MEVGQTYKIKYIYYNTNADVGVLRQKLAKLIFKGKHFYTFEYKSKMGDMIRVTIDKHDFRRNPSMIQEV
jgi:hypothetical protein